MVISLKWNKLFLHRFSKWKYFLACLYVIGIGNIVSSQVIYPDGGRNVIKLTKVKPIRVMPYNDGSIMTHVIGSGGMNFLYYFHMLGVSCENNDPAFYKIIQADFQFCVNKTGPLPSEVRDQPLGSIPKPCYDWKIRRPCYKNLADDYDECLAGRPGLVKKGTDALRFTHAYAKFICGNIADTKAHLLDRYMKHDLIVDGVFQCFPHLQERINNCVKRDKVSKTLCSKFFIVHACFGKYYNDDNCHDVQPIYYMDDLFRNMSASLNCPKNENEWMNRPSPPNGGWSSTQRPGWTSREQYSNKENPWPGEVGRPWSTEKGKEPFVRGEGNGWNKDHHNHHHHHQHHEHPSHDHGWSKGWSSGERGREKPRERERLIDRIDPHANRPYPDTSWNTRPWVDVMDRGTTGLTRPWNREKNPNSIESSRGSGTYSTRGPSRTQFLSSTPRGPSRGQFISSTPRESSRRQFIPSSRGSNRGHFSSSTPRGPGGGYQTLSLPPAGYAVTRKPQESSESDYGHGRRFFSTRESPPLDEIDDENDKMQNDDIDNNNDGVGYSNFYSFK